MGSRIQGLGVGTGNVGTMTGKASEVVMEYDAKKEDGFSGDSGDKVFHSGRS